MSRRVKLEAGCRSRLQEKCAWRHSICLAGEARFRAANSAAPDQFHPRPRLALSESVQQLEDPLFVCVFAKTSFHRPSASSFCTPSFTHLRSGSSTNSFTFTFLTDNHAHTASHSLSATSATTLLRYGTNQSLRSTAFQRPLGKHSSVLFR